MILAFHMTTVPGFYASRTNGSLRPRTELDYYDELGLPRPERIGIFTDTGRGEHPDHKHVFFSAHAPVMEGRFGYIFDADFLISDMGATVRANFWKAITVIIHNVVNSTSIDIELPTSKEIKGFFEKNADSIEIETLRRTTINNSDNEIFMIMVMQGFRRSLFNGLHEKSNERIINNVRNEIEKEYKALAAYFEIDNPPAIESILDTTISDAAWKSNYDAITNYFRDDEAMAIIKHHPDSWHTYCEIMVDRAVPLDTNIGEIEKGETVLDQTVKQQEWQQMTQGVDWK